MTPPATADITSLDEFWDREDLGDTATATSGDTPAPASSQPSQPAAAAPAEAPVDTPVPEASTDEATVAADAQLPTGYKRDERGRVHRPDGTIASKDEVAKFPKADPAAATAAPPAASDPAAAPAKPAANPFRYRAGGATHDFEGSSLNEDGSVTIAADKISALREALNARHAIAADSQFADRARNRVAELEAHVQRLEQGSTAEASRAQALVGALTKILQNPDDAKAIDAFFELRASYPQLLAKAETEFWKTRASTPAAERSDARSQDRSDSTQRQPAGLPPREVAVNTTRECLEHLKLDHTLRDLTADDWKQIGDRLERTSYAFLRPATAEDAQQYGVRVGEVVYDKDLFHEDAMDHVSGLRKTRETAATREKIAADNARKTMPAINAPPTAASVTKPPAKTPGKIQSKEDMDDYWDSDEL